MAISVFDLVKFTNRVNSILEWDTIGTLSKKIGMKPDNLYHDLRRAKELWGKGIVFGWGGAIRLPPEVTAEVIRRQIQGIELDAARDIMLSRGIKLNKESIWRYTKIGLLDTGPRRLNGKITVTKESLERLITIWDSLAAKHKQRRGKRVPIGSVPEKSKQKKKPGVQKQSEPEVERKIKPLLPNARAAQIAEECLSDLKLKYLAAEIERNRGRQVKLTFLISKVGAFLRGELDKEEARRVFERALDPKL